MIAKFIFPNFLSLLKNIFYILFIYFTFIFCFYYSIYCYIERHILPFFLFLFFRIEKNKLNFIRHLLYRSTCCLYNHNKIIDNRAEAITEVHSSPLRALRIVCISTNSALFISRQLSH